MSEEIDPIQYPDLNEDETSQSEAKYWIFTQFYYDQKIEYTNPDGTKEMITREETIQRFATYHCSYLTYGKEKATTTLTPHLQGCMVLKIKKRFTFIKNNSNNGIHLKKMKSCLLANIIYCHKEKNWWTYKAKNFIEPKKPKSLTGKKYIERCNEAIQKAKYGNILDIDADILIGNLKNLQQIKYLEISKDVQLNLLLGTKFGNYFQNHFLWLKGKTGTLKSYNTHKIGQILFKFLCKYNDMNNLPLPNANIYKVPYTKDLNKWFQNYCFEKIMIIEEADLNFCKNNVSRFKRWFDQYAFPGEFKGGDVGLIRPEFIIVTSNYSLQECFTQDGMDYDKDYLPMKRRVMEIDLDKKGYIIWPNLKLLTIEYNSKQAAFEYDKNFTNNMYNLQEKLFDNIYTKEKITDPNKIKEIFENYTKYIELEEAENILNKNKIINATPSTIKNNSNSQTNFNNNTNIAILVPETQQQENIYSTPKRKSIDHIIIPETPIKKNKGKEPSLERQNAFILSNSLESIINTEESITPPNTPTFETFESEIEEIDENIENFNQLTNSQETTIPQTDGANDSFELPKNKEKPNTSFTDGNNNTWISLKQKNFIEKQINTCIKINKIIKTLKQKNKYSNDLLKNKHYKTQIDLFLLKKQKIIKQFKLDKYNWIDDDQYIDPNECHYCNSKTLNCCTCLGYYFDTLPFDNFEHKKIFIITLLKKIENKELKTLDNIKTYVLVMSNKLQNLYNEYANVENIIYEMKKDTNNTFDKIYSLKNRLDLTLININDIIKKNNLQLYKKTFKTNKCFYCTNNIKNICECKGKWFYIDQFGNKKYEPNKFTDNNDVTFDQYQEEDYHASDF